MTKTLLVAVGLMVMGQFSGTAQHAQLTAEDIAAAIARGADKPKRMKGLDMQDQASLFAGESTGFSIVVYTPTTWVAQRAANATRSYTDFSPSDIDDEDLQPVLRVIVRPNMPRRVTSKGMRHASSVEHVVLRDEARETAIQPILFEPFGAEAANAMGASVEFAGATAFFDLGDVRRIRGADGTAEFFITVVSDTGLDKDFKIKKKHFKDLP